MNVSAVYNPTDSYQPITQQDDSAGQPAKRKFMSFDSVMQASNTAQHRTYHVPPGKNVFENIKKKTLIFFYVKLKLQTAKKRITGFDFTNFFENFFL